MASPGTSGYREVAAHLRRAIICGDYPPGTTLPKQAEIATSSGVNIGTIRKAISLLESEGLVTPVRRRGTVVRARPPMRRLGTDRYAKNKWKFGELVAFGADREASGQNWSPSDQTQTVRRVPADPQVAEAFDISPGQPVYERARLVKDAGRPTHTLTSYYLPEHVEGTPLVDDRPGPAGRGGGFAVLTLQGLEPHHIERDVFIQDADPRRDRNAPATGRRAGHAPGASHVDRGRPHRRVRTRRPCRKPVPVDLYLRHP